MNETIYAVIIDDEATFISSFEILVKAHFHEIVIVGTGKNVKTGVELINRLKPQLVFLDVNLPDGMGFDILDQVKESNFEVIFTTGYTRYAIRAFEIAALHYLTKPISVEKLKEAIKRFHEKNDNNHFNIQLKTLKESLLETPRKILLPSIDGYKLVNISDIVYCEASNNYTFIYFIDKLKEMISKPLISLEHALEDMDFVRIHAKYLINMKYVSKFRAGRNAEVTMLHGQELPISQPNIKLFKDSLNQYSKIPT